MDRGKKTYNDYKKQSSRDVKSEECSRDKNQNDDKNKDGRSHSNKDRGLRDYKNEKEIKYEYGLQKNDKNNEKVEVKKEEPSLVVSGNLAKDTNLYNGVVIKYNEPVEARKPKKRWRLYVFKGEEELPFYPIHRQSAYLFGRERKIADIPVDHPSCSKQHAVFQYRLVSYKKDDGSNGRAIRPYIIDLGSTNGTYINNERIESQRYYELREKDVIKFGFSSREYVLLHEDSKAKDEYSDKSNSDSSSSSKEDDDKNVKKPKPIKREFEVIEQREDDSIKKRKTVDYNYGEDDSGEED